MEVFWVCETCGASGIDYFAGKKCDICSTAISPLSEFECLYAVSEDLCRSAESADEYIAAADSYDKALRVYQRAAGDTGFTRYPKTRRSKTAEIFTRAGKAREECYAIARRMIITEEKYDGVLEHIRAAELLEESEQLEAADMEYSAAQELGNDILRYKDVPSLMIRCKEARDRIRTALSYRQAADLLSHAETIDDYQRAAALFQQIPEFGDSKAKRAYCMDHIRALKISDQLSSAQKDMQDADSEPDLAQRAEKYDRIILNYGKSSLSAEVDAILASSELKCRECRDELYRLEQEALFAGFSGRFADLKKEQNLPNREAGLSDLINDLQPHFSKERFSALLREAQDVRDHTSKQIRYDNALAGMKSASTETDYRNAKVLFGSLEDFSDSAEKAKACDTLAEEARMNKIYEDATEKLNRAKHTNLFSLFGKNRY